MYSLNYHRFVLHLYLYAIQLGKLNQSPFSNHLISALSNSINYLSRLIDPATGQMPVYGSNDGALVLPLNNCDFSDYRPLLQLGSVITTGQPMFEAGEWDEDVFWLCSGEIEKKEESDALSLSKGGKRLEPVSFPNGGVYVLRGENSKAVIRCTDFQSRPSHADQLHVDLWMGAHHIACDAGTYLYSGEGIWRNGLARTSAHNTATVDGKDQMTLVSRFTWTDWARGKVLKQTDSLWQGEHDGYKPIRHKRTVMALESDRWLVLDNLESNQPHRYTLHWLLNDVPFTQNKNSLLLNYEARSYKIQMGLINGEGKFTILRADPNSTYGWRSRYYAHKEPAISLLLETHQPTVRFWTFFGFENDNFEWKTTAVLLNGEDISLKDV
jgi:asparagine synthase (glutamine-hydrolysing)